LRLQAAESIEADRHRLEQHRRQSLERATYQTDVAQRRYAAVDPENRLVAAELERQWEAALRSQRSKEEELERFRQQQPARLSASQRHEVARLARKIPALWHAGTTSGTERQFILRTLIERVTVTLLGCTERISVTILWAGGFESQHEIRRAVRKFENLEAADAIVVRLCDLRQAGCSLPEIAAALNAEGYRSAKGRPFTTPAITQLCCKLRRQRRLNDSRQARLDVWRSQVLAERLGVKATTLNTWRRRGWVQAERVGSRWLYWADTAELARLEQLTAHARKRFTSTPAELINPRSHQPQKQRLERSL
jgi:hypothetical protein